MSRKNTKGGSNVHVVCPRRKAGELYGERRTPSSPVELSLEFLNPLFTKPLNVVSNELGISATAIKKACRKFGIPKWPFRTLTAKNSRNRIAHPVVAPSTSSAKASKPAKAAVHRETSAPSPAAAQHQAQRIATESTPSKVPTTGLRGDEAAKVHKKAITMTDTTASSDVQQPQMGDSSSSSSNNKPVAYRSLHPYTFVHQPATQPFHNQQQHHHHVGYMEPAFQQWEGQQQQHTAPLPQQMAAPSGYQLHCNVWAQQQQNHQPHYEQHHQLRQHHQFHQQQPATPMVHLHSFQAQAPAQADAQFTAQYSAVEETARQPGYVQLPMNTHQSLSRVESEVTSMSTSESDSDSTAAFEGFGGAAFDPFLDEEEAREEAFGMQVRDFNNINPLGMTHLEGTDSFNKQVGADFGFDGLNRRTEDVFEAYQPDIWM